MSGRVRVGYPVKLIYGWPDGSEWVRYGILVHRPQGAGDVFYFKIDDKSVAVNPYHSALMGFEEISEEEYAEAMARAALEKARAIANADAF